MNRKTTAAIAAAIAAVAIGGGAYAAKSTGQEDDALAIVNAQVTLSQAIAAAEQHVGGGKAAKAEFEQENGKWAFDVEVVKDRKVMDVKVDATNGKVLSATEDKVDHDDGNDKKD
jgi:uncharacterized membrane protein YkoI